MIEDLEDSESVNPKVLKNMAAWHKGAQYLRIAGLFVKHTRPQEFRNFIREVLDPKDFIKSSVHRCILNTRFRGIVTTNFDQIFEFNKPSLSRSRLIYPSCLDDIDGFREDFFFAKIHGCVSQAYDPEKLVLTGKDYADLRDNRKYQEILRTLYIGNTFLTVGFSLSDPDFLGLLNDFKETFGAAGPVVYAFMREDEAKHHKALENRNVRFLTYKHHGELLGLFEEIKRLAPPKSVARASRVSPLLSVPPPPSVDGVKPSRRAEPAFLRAASAAPLKLGRLDLQCQLFPQKLWNVQRPDHLYGDDPEAERQIVLRWVNTPLPDDTLAILVDEIQSRLARIKAKSLTVPKRESASLKEVYRRLTQQGSNAYPRLVALPKMMENRVPVGPDVLEVSIGPSRYGVALVEERKLQIPTALNLRKNHILNSLAVRVAYVYERKGEKWLEFHQRKGGPNATYKNAWDVGAAGYIDPSRHRDPDVRGRVSPWLACAFELSEELGIPTFQLPHRDHYHFLGVGRNSPTGQLDLLAFCEAVVSPDASRPATARVQKFGRCRLDPESVASFVLSRRRWVPTALLTLILTLEAFGYSRDQIRSAFAKLAGKLHLSP